MSFSTDDIQSDYLFARPSFIEGIGRIFDLSGSFNTYNQSRTPEEADARAVLEDWIAVGHDVHVALEQLHGGSDEPR